MILRRREERSKDCIIAELEAELAAVRECAGVVLALHQESDVDLSPYYDIVAVGRRLEDLHVKQIFQIEDGC